MLRATRVWDGDAAAASRRGPVHRRDRGRAGLPSYTDEPGVDPALSTETLAEVTFEIDNWRWAGVPFALRSGKALGDTRKEIVDHVQGRAAPARAGSPARPAGPSCASASTRARSSWGCASTARATRSRSIRCGCARNFAPGELPPYGEVLSGILDDDPTLSVRADKVEECWRIVTPVLAAWKNNEVPIDEYPAGSAGPTSWTSTPGLD